MEARIDDPYCYRYAEGKLGRLPALATELANIPVDVIVARGLTIRAAQQTTAKIPIVMAADSDPVRSGFVASLARPGGNITGFSTQALDSQPKQLEFLREALPSVERVAVLTNANSADREDMKRIGAVGRALRFELTEYPISGAEQMPDVLALVAKAREGAIFVSPMLCSLTLSNSRRSRSGTGNPRSTICAHLQRREF